MIRTFQRAYARGVREKRSAGGQKMPYAALRLRAVLFLLTTVCAIGGMRTCVSAQTPSREDEACFVARRAFEDGFYEVSLGLFDKFLSVYPSSSRAAEAELIRGQCYYHQGKYIDALKTFEGLMARSSARTIHDAVLYWIAEVHFRGNNFTKAADLYRKLIAQYPQSSYLPAVHYSLGWCLFQERLYQEAMDEFSTVTARYPHEPIAVDATFKIIECLYQLKNYSELKKKLPELLKTAASDPAKVPYLTFYLAEAQYYSNEFEAALSNYERVSAAETDEKLKNLACLGRAWSVLKLKKYAEAQAVFDQVGQLPDKGSADVLLLGKAVLAAETKQLNAAADLYEQLILTSEDPLSVIQGHLGKAEVFYNMAEYQKAEEAYLKARERLREASSPEIADKLHYGLAWTYLKQGEFKLAIDEFQKMVNLTEDKVIKVAALCQIGDAYQDAGDYTKSSETYDRILKEYPDSLYSDYVQYQLGITLLKSSNYDGAILAFQTLKGHFPDSKLIDDASYALGLSYFQREDYAASRDSFEQFRRDYKDSSLAPEAAYLLGTSLYNLEKFEQAIEAFTFLIKHYSDSIDMVQKAEYEIADCYYRMGNEREAMERFTQLRTKYPDSSLTPEVIWWLGEYYYRHNDLTLARRYFSSLIQDFPKSPLVIDAYYALGSIAQEEGAFDESIASFEKVITLGKSDLAGTATVAIADIYAQRSEYEVAFDKYQLALSSYKHLGHLILPKIAHLYRQIGKFPEALDYYRKALDTVPAREMGRIQFEIAETRETSGAVEQAIEEYVKVTYLYAEQHQLVVKALLRVAFLYEGEENFNEALAVYSKISSLNVDESKYANERIDWIKTQVK